MEERFCALLLLSLAAVGTSGIHTETVELDEGEETTIECPRPLVQRLNITNAWYWTDTCESPGTLQKLQVECGDKPSCTVRAGDDVFGDSCQGEARLEFTYECWNLPGYYGCFEDSGWPNRALSGHDWTSNSLTVQACLKRCRDRDYKYAGVEYTYECFCGNNENFHRYGEKTFSECGQRCNGDNEQYCGGSWRIEVYESSMGRPCANQTLDGSRHYVYSPDFPGLYPDSKSCKWTIQARDDKVVKLRFALLNLTSGGVIQVRDGTESSQELATLSGLTGATVPSIPASSGSAIWVQFQSADGRGRFIFWSQEIDHCGAIPLSPTSGTAVAPYVGHVGVGETAVVTCDTGGYVWVRCGEDQRFNDTWPYCQDKTTTISSTLSSTRETHRSLPTQEGSSTPQDSLNPPTKAAQTGEGTGNTVTFIAVGVAVPLVVIATVAIAVVVCRRKGNTASKSGGSTQASAHEFLSSRAGAPPSGSVGLSSLEARYVANGGNGDPSDEHLYATPDDGRARETAKPRRGDRTKNRSPEPAVNQNHDEGFTENDLYETADDVTARPGSAESEAGGTVENIIYGEID